MTKKIDEKRRMTIAINGETYPLRFGIKFLKEINQVEDGLIMAVAGLLEGDVEEVFRMLKASMNTHDAVTVEQLEEYIEFDADIDKLVEDFLLILPAMNTTKKIVSRSLPRLKKLQENQEKMQDLTMKEMEAEVLGKLKGQNE